MRCLFITALLTCAGCHLIYPFDVERRSDAVADASVPPDASADGDLAALDLRADAPDGGGLDAAPDAAAPDAAGPDTAAPEAGVITLAGTGAAGYKDGPADKAQFYQPAGIAVDSKGVVYVTEEYNHTVRKIEQGLVSTIAGSGTAGYKDGVGISAQFNLPTGIVVNPVDGSLLVTDQKNHRIRMIKGTTVSTLAGSGASGGKDGPLLAASFADPHGIAMGAGTIYVVEYAGHRVRMIVGTTVSTLAGSVYGFLDGAAASAQFALPAGVGVDSAGTVFVADYDNARLRSVAKGIVATAAGSAAKGYLDGAALQARFKGCGDVVVSPGGVLYVADFDDSRIRAVKSGTVSTLVGDGTGGHKDGALSQARLNHPHSLAIGPDGRIYVTDFSGHRVRVIQP